MSRPLAMIYGTGVEQEAGSKHMAPLPPPNGRHLFVFTAVWAVANPARDAHHFDMENLITVAGPGCLHCEQLWTPTMGAKCPGEPPEES